tara:strand:+ start:456 stop:641 length:186 start_codon:yes stop_codon:yes gene_type:complete
MKIKEIKEILENAHLKEDHILGMELDAIEVVLDFNTSALTMLEYNYLRATRLLIIDILDNR